MSEPRTAAGSHKAQPKLMDAGQQWYCTVCNRPVHRVTDRQQNTRYFAHGHDETHSADWPSCLPAHIAMNRYRARLAEAANKP